MMSVSVSPWKYDSFKRLCLPGKMAHVSPSSVVLCSHISPHPDPGVEQKVGGGGHHKWQGRVAEFVKLQMLQSVKSDVGKQFGFPVS